MTIQVKITHGDAGHPAPIYVTQKNADGTPTSAPVITIKEGDSVVFYIHANLSLHISERPIQGELV